MNTEPFIEIAREVDAIKSYKELIKYIDNIYKTDKFDFLVMYAKSLYLYTTGNLPTIRDASLYDPKKAAFDRENVPLLVKALSNYTDEIWRGQPTKFDFRIAGWVLEALAVLDGISAEPIGQLYRGMNKLPASVYLGLCKPGEIYEIGKFASTSRSKGVAEYFSDDRPRWNLVYYLDNSKLNKGLPSQTMTSGYPHEFEVVVGGNIKITGFEFIPDWELVLDTYTGSKPETVTDFDELIRVVNVYEKFIAHSQWLPGNTKVYAEVL